MSEGFDWAEEGRAVGVTLDACYAVVVTGSDPVATAEAALGIGRVQAQHRRVAIADLIGDVPPIQSLLEDDSAPGLTDSFEFGVSLGRIAYKVPDAGDLFVMPSGSLPLDHAELFVHPRWAKLAAGFREEGALLLLLAPSDAPNVLDLVDVTDGAVIVGDVVPPDLPVALSRAWIRQQRSVATRASAAVPPAFSTPHGVTAPVPPTVKRRWAGPVAGVALAIAIVAGGIWLMRRPLASMNRRSPPGVPASSRAAAASAPVLRADTMARDSLARDSVVRFTPSAALANDSFPVLPVTNPADSAAATGFAVELEQTLTPAFAILNIAGKYKGLPATSYAQVKGTHYYQIVSGASPSQAGADSLLVRLRAAGTIPAGSGKVVTVPYAFLVQADVPASQVAARVASFARRAQPVYALRQPNGTARLYFGAFDSPQQAALAVPAVKKVVATPTLVFRIGRVF